MRAAKTMPSGGPAPPASPGDYFTWRPWIWALCLWVVAVLVPISLSGLNDVLGVLWFLLVGIPTLSAAPGVALIFVLVHLVRRRWRAASSIALASAAFAFAALVSREFHDELKWYVLQS